MWFSLLNQSFPKPIGVSEFRKAMRSFPASVSIVTTGSQGTRFGMTASSVTGLSDSPASLILCVNREASSHEALARCRVFAVNLLNENNADLAEKFSSAPQSERFVGSRWKEGPFGLPMVADGAQVFCCTKNDVVEAFSHSIIVGTIFGVEGNCPNALLYRDGAFARCTGLINK
jgi:flavin reductase